MGTHMRLLSESYPMNTNMTGFRCFSNICILVLWTKLASALEGIFISAGADLSPRHQSPVSKALCYGKLELAIYLVERGSSVRAKDYNIQGADTPVLCMAIEKGRIYITACQSLTLI